MMSSLNAIQSLAELQAKFRPEALMSFEAESVQSAMRDGSESSGQSSITQELSPFESNEPAIPKEINYRGQTVVGFDLRGTDMLCLPQVYELFLKNMVGGLHTVYTKLKRLEITPIICNVEQVRALRSKNAIQPGVNRCKLIAATDFDRLYDDCTNTCTRPGRPPKRASVAEEWTTKREKFNDQQQQQSGNDTDFSVAPCSTQLNPLFLGQLLPQFSAQQLLVQHMMVLAAAHAQPETHSPTSMTMLPNAEAEGAPLNLSKSNSNSETSDSDSLESMRKESDISPNQSDRGGSNSGSSSSSDPSTTVATTKIISLIDMASEHFKHQMESIRKEREEIELLRCQLKGSLIDERKLQEQLQAEKKKSNIYFRRYCKARREMFLLKEQMSETRGSSSNSNSTA
ncbi:hypothetical protein GCK32_003110 [Trichostrongylus colubriformis]|uniref:SKI/SNO/DAC domain-containing protein n=1 Tax=Trichostrongylus colubriformis TaxID=6319 RepID=A0AAN8FN19_TRICO